jgi:hypothetical protein
MGRQTTQARSAGRALRRDLLPREGLAVQLDLDLLRGGELGRRHRDLEHAVSPLGVQLPRVDPLGNGRSKLPCASSRWQ